jgi:1-acyl-sn-glycerol-3-phosphate acyltransferase
MFLGALNDNLFKNALVLLITYKSISLFGLNSGALVAMCGGVFILPFFLFSATAGQLADKLSKTTMIRATKITEFIVMTLAALGFYFENFNLLMLVLFLMGTQSTFFGPLKYGIIPQLIKRDELVVGNAYIGGGTFLAILVGTILGGVSVSSDDPTIITSFGVLFISFIGIVTSYMVKNVEPVDNEVKPDFTFVRPTIDIIKLTMKEKSIFHTCMGISWFWFIGAAILSLIPGLCKDIFNGSEAVGTMFLATFTIGMGIGSFVAERLSQKRPEVGMVPIAAVFMSIFLADLAYCATSFSSSSPTLLNVSQFFEHDYSVRAVLDLLLVSIFGGTYIIPQFTYLQDFTPRNILSRIIAGNNIWNAIFMVSAAVMIMGLSMIGLKISHMFYIIALMNFIFSFYLFFVNSATTWRFICWFLSKVMYRLEIEGREHIPDEGPVVMACNHVSFVDWIMIMSASPRPVRFVIDHAYYYARGMKFWLRQAHLIPIATKRENPQVLQEAFEEMERGLTEGHVLGIFPEGWITRDGKMRPLQPGINKIVSMHPEVVIVPMVIKGLWGSFYSFEGKGVLKGLSLKRRKVTLKILPAIKATEFDLKQLEKQLHTEVE